MSSKNDSTKKGQGTPQPAHSVACIDPAITAEMLGPTHFAAVFSMETKTGTVTLERRKVVLPWLTE